MTSGLFVFLNHFTAEYPFASHSLVFLSTFFQGEVGAFFGLTLLVNKNIGWSGFFIAVASGIFMADLLPYFVGRFTRDKKLGRFLEKHLPYREHIEHHLSNNLIYFFILVKFLIGLNFAVMFLSGWSKIKFQKFLKTIILAFSFWFIFISIFGYFLISSLAYLKAAKIFKQMEIGLAAIIILVFLTEFCLRKIIFKKEEETEKKAKILGEKIGHLPR